MYERISAIMPSRLTRTVQKQLDYVDMSVKSEKFLGFILLYTIILSLGAAYIIFKHFELPANSVFISGPAAFILLNLFVWVPMNFAGDSRGKYVERILPDALQLFASNVKAGITPERALFLSARPEFGPLQKELRIASRKVMSGISLQEALLDISSRIKSKNVERIMWLTTKGIASGAELGGLLTELANDLRTETTIEEEIKANISMYVLLIFFSAGIGAPLLFGISSFIVEVLAVQMSQLATAELGDIALQALGGAIIGVPTNVVDPEFIVRFVAILLGVGEVFAGLTIGVINKGKEKYGFKYIPYLLIIGYLIFYLTRRAMLEFFGQLL